ncbi:hypothetical protein L6164_003421 [Bauhinia variegata]|uniref:Uncharacterized protein n=1 Tax=Bauhinia variegata TaxID=167791 RepID=A0ACB9Q1W1_BAUVA|nr:hypothetical protein L6164_003421 [Bauhinia variegata]
MPLSNHIGPWENTSAGGLKVLRDNNLIHRDLKPQNLLLSRNDDKSVLKIADFGFAGSLQPRGLAETLCGSPLYMAPKIMQLQKSLECWCNFISACYRKNTFYRKQSIQFSMDCGFRLTQRDPLRRTEENSQEDCLPFFLDDDSTGPEGSPSFSRKKSSMKSTSGFDVKTKIDKADSASTTSNNRNFTSRHDTMAHQPENTTNLWNKDWQTQGLKVADSLENIDQDYVLVSGPPVDVSSSSVSASKPSHSAYKSGGSPQESSNIITRLSAPMPIVGVATDTTYQIGSSESQGTAPGTSQGSMDTADEQPSADCMTRIKSLQQCASTFMELVNEKEVQNARCNGDNISVCPSFRETWGWKSSWTIWKVQLHCIQKLCAC